MNVSCVVTVMGLRIDPISQMVEVRCSADSNGFKVPSEGGIELRESFNLHGEQGKVKADLGSRYQVEAVGAPVIRPDTYKDVNGMQKTARKWDWMFQIKSMVPVKG